MVALDDALSQLRNLDVHFLATVCSERSSLPAGYPPGLAALTACTAKPIRFGIQRGGEGRFDFRPSDGGTDFSFVQSITDHSFPRYVQSNWITERKFMIVEKNVLTIAEFGKIYGIGKTRTYEEINSGRLRAIKIGRRTFVTVEDAEAWLKACPAFVSKKSRMAGMSNSAQWTLAKR